MSNYETSSNNSVLAPKTSCSTSQPVDKPLKRVVPAVELKIMQTEIFGVRNRAAVSANAWLLPVLPTPGAAVSIIHGANIATGHTWNRVLSNLPPLHLNWTFPSTCLPDGAGKLIRNPMHFVCERDAAPSFPTVAIDGRAFTSGNAISMPADPQVHGPSRGSLGWLPVILRAPLGPINVKAVQSPPLSILILAAAFFVLVANALNRCRTSESSKASSVSGQFLGGRIFSYNIYESHVSASFALRNLQLWINRELPNPVSALVGRFGLLQMAAQLPKMAVEPRMPHEMAQMLLLKATGYEPSSRHTSHPPYTP
ncbi:hypothetical protein B0H13DRAFT_2268440, partial [Mycena leptocephala]